MNHTDPPRWVTALAIALFFAAVVGCGFHTYLHIEGYCHCALFPRSTIPLRAIHKEKAGIPPWRTCLLDMK